MVLLDVFCPKVECSSTIIAPKTKHRQYVIFNEIIFHVKIVHFVNSIYSTSITTDNKHLMLKIVKQYYVNRYSFCFLKEKSPAFVILHFIIIFRVKIFLPWRSVTIYVLSE